MQSPRRARRLAVLLPLLILSACASARTELRVSHPARAIPAHRASANLAPDGGPSLRAEIVRTAADAVGSPYLHGAEGPDAFDCSGLVLYSYASAGVAGLPRDSRSLYSSTRRISLDELRPGDLLFFDFGAREVSHVGIYLGSREFVHAPKSGRAVERVRFDHPYWRRQLRLAGRVRGLR